MGAEKHVKRTLTGTFYVFGGRTCVLGTSNTEKRAKTARFSCPEVVGGAGLPKHVERAVIGAFYVFWEHGEVEMLGMWGNVSKIDKK